MVPSRDGAGRNGSTHYAGRREHASLAAGRVNAFETTGFRIYCSDSTEVTSVIERSPLMG